jgi:sirohydrochlorin ferrochelatase
MNGMDALILFSHGSLLCGAGEALDTHAGRLRASGQWPVVAVGYMNYSEPTFAEAVAECSSQGATRIVVLPFFLIPGYFVSKTLPDQLNAVKADYPQLEFVVADAIGFDTGLADALIASALDPLGPDQWRDDLTAAARGCRARPDCPLYATPNCPRVPAPDTPMRLFVE